MGVLHRIPLYVTSQLAVARATFQTPCNTILDRIEKTRYSTNMPGPDSKNDTLPEGLPIPPPRPTIPSTPRAIATELEPVIERACKEAAEFVLDRLENRLVKIEHSLEVAAKHDALFLTEIMSLKLRVDNLDKDMERVKAQILLKQPAKTKLVTKKTKP